MLDVPSLAEGTLVANRYRLIRRIGLGGMGEVWLAHDLSLDSECAVKLVHTADRTRLEEFRVRFECEAKCAAQIRSPHVVDVLDRGVWNDLAFIVMEFMDGEDLSTRLGRVNRLDALSTYAIIAQVARALVRAHAQGIVHRDLKPANIYLVPGDEHEMAKVLDFGTATLEGFSNPFENKAASGFIGTPCYMSPEQTGGAGVDWRSDLWTLGVIAFECLTGGLPFEGASVGDIVSSIVREPIPRLRDRTSELPEQLEAWWKRAAARDRGLRFQSAKELADAFADAIGVRERIAIWTIPHASPSVPVLELSSAASPHRPPASLASARTAVDLPKLLPRGELDVPVVFALERSRSSLLPRKVGRGLPPAVRRARRSGLIFIAVGFALALLLTLPVVARQPESPLKSQAAVPGEHSGRAPVSSRRPARPEIVPLEPTGAVDEALPPTIPATRASGAAGAEKSIVRKRKPPPVRLVPKPAKPAAAPPDYGI